SSSEIRAGRQDVHIGLVGESSLLNKFGGECKYVNGASVSGIYTLDDSNLSTSIKELSCQVSCFEELLEMSDALYIVSHPSRHYGQIKQALLAGKHVLCESPMALSIKEQEELEQIAHEKSLVLMDSVKTAYSTAYNRMLLLVKSGRIGKVVSVDAVCTSLSDLEKRGNKPDANTWNSICAWGPTALLPVFQLLGTDYLDKQICSFMLDKDFDVFTKVAFVYPHALASVKIGKGAKSEGELIISGTNGYIYIPAPWWKTDYFEIRYENPADNKRYFYHLEGEGIRFEIVSFLKSIKMKNYNYSYIDESHSRAIVKIIEDFYAGDLTVLK
ncbi:MAG: Gfo/Idh/MocA family oxidoreductase, partial [Muribaculaceae bacterium]|nr:Gfo/Idh/MocA family oxidoreductase [Muribaculaceae bacterium]